MLQNCVISLIIFNLKSYENKKEITIFFLQIFLCTHTFVDVFLCAYRFVQMCACLLLVCEAAALLEQNLAER